MNNVTGNLLHATSGIIVHGCNAQGVMGSGVAKDMKETYPEAFLAYRKAYEEKGLRVGDIIWVKVKNDPLLMVANAITQEFYGRDTNRVYVSYPAIEEAFNAIGVAARKYSLDVHYPKIGAGLANGDWSIIEAIIQKSLHGVNHSLWVPSQKMTPQRRGPR